MNDSRRLRNTNFKIGKAYYTTDQHHQVFTLVDSDYGGGTDYLPLLESLSFPVLMKFIIRPVPEKVSSSTLGKYIADRKSEIRYSRTMGDSEREKLNRQIYDLENMSSRIGARRSLLVNLFASFRVSLEHPVKLRESAATFSSVMKLMGLIVRPVEYISTNRLKEMSSPKDNVGKPYLMDTHSASSIFPLSFTPVPKAGGVALGVDDITEKPVFLDIFNKNSHNVLIFGETGSGKSFFAKILLMRFATTRSVDSIAILDPLDEYACSMFPGSCKVVALNADSGIPHLDRESEHEENGSGNVDVEIYKISNLLDDDSSRKMIALLGRIYNAMAENPNRRKMILIDEAHLVLANKNSLEMLSRMIRHSRHYRASVICVTQNPDDLSRNHLSNVIAENSSSVFIFRSRGMGRAELNRFGLQAFGDLDAEDLSGGRNSPYSECLFVENGRLKKTRILGSKLESDIIDAGE